MTPFQKGQKVCLRKYPDICMYVKEVDNKGNCIVWWLDKNGSYNQQYFEYKELTRYGSSWSVSSTSASGSFTIW